MHQFQSFVAGFLLCLHPKIVVCNQWRLKLDELIATSNRWRYFPNAKKLGVSKAKRGAQYENNDFSTTIGISLRILRDIHSIKHLEQAVWETRTSQSTSKFKCSYLAFLQVRERTSVWCLCGMKATGNCLPVIGCLLDICSYIPHKQIETWIMVVKNKMYEHEVNCAT